MTANENEPSHNFGTFDNPVLHNLISPKQSCRVHLVFNHLEAENVKTTHGIPITLSKPMDSTFMKSMNILNIYQNKGWTCEFFIMYAKAEKSTLSELTEI